MVSSRTADKSCRFRGRDSTKFWPNPKRVSAEPMRSMASLLRSSCGASSGSSQLASSSAPQVRAAGQASIYSAQFNRPANATRKFPVGLKNIHKIRSNPQTYGLSKQADICETLRTSRAKGGRDRRRSERFCMGQKPTPTLSLSRALRRAKMGPKR